MPAGAFSGLAPAYGGKLRSFNAKIELRRAQFFPTTCGYERSSQPFPKNKALLYEYQGVVLRCLISLTEPKKMAPVHMLFF